MKLTTVKEIVRKLSEVTPNLENVLVVVEAKKRALFFNTIETLSTLSKNNGEFLTTENAIAHFDKSKKVFDMFWSMTFLDTKDGSEATYNKLKGYFIKKCELDELAENFFIEDENIQGKEYALRFSKFASIEMKCIIGYCEEIIPILNYNFNE